MGHILTETFSDIIDTTINVDPDIPHRSNYNPQSAGKHRLLHGQHKGKRSFAWIKIFAVILQCFVSLFCFSWYMEDELLCPSSRNNPSGKRFPGFRFSGESKWYSRRVAKGRCWKHHLRSKEISFPHFSRFFCYVCDSECWFPNHCQKQNISKASKLSNAVGYF